MKLLYSIKCLLLSFLVVWQTMPSLGYTQTASNPECVGMYSDNPLYLDNCNRCKQRLDMLWDPAQKMCTANLNTQTARVESDKCFDERNKLTATPSKAENEALKKNELNCLMKNTGEFDKVNADLSLGGYLDKPGTLEKVLKSAGSFLSGYLLIQAIEYAKIPVKRVPGLISTNDCEDVKITAAYWFGLAGALTLIAGEVINYITFNAGMKQISDDFNNFVAETNGNKLQEAAFTTLSLEQKVLGNHLRNKSIVFLLTGALYLVAFTISLFEFFTNPLSKESVTCSINNKSNFQNFITTALNSLFKKSILINTSHAESDSLMNPEGIKKGAEYIVTTEWTQVLTSMLAGMGTAAILGTNTLQTFVKNFGALFRPIVYGLNATFSIVYGIMLLDKAKTAYRHVSDIEETKSSFMVKFNYVQCTDDDRTNFQKPECYCYLPSGQPNPQRSTSSGQVCKAELEGFKLKNTGTGSDYSLGLSSSGVKGCLDNNNKFDEKCKCATQLGSNGSDNCKKFNPITIPGLGGVAQYNPLLSNANSLFNGKKTTGNLNAASIISTGDKSAIALKDFVQTNKTAMNEAGMPVGPFSEENKLVTALDKDLKAIANSPGGAPVPYYEQNGLKNMLSKDKAEILKKIIQDNKLEEVKYKGGNAAISNSNTKKDDFAFNLNNKGTSADGKADVKEYMDKNYKYNNKDNDINKNESVPIWKILSNRYQSSGVPVLIPE